MSTLKFKEWQSASGRWYCNDNTHPQKWWVPARMLGLSLTDFILLIKDKYGATIHSYCLKTDVLIYSFNTEAEVHKFVLFINREARKRNYLTT